jgi:hypothetical protein
MWGDAIWTAWIAYNDTSFLSGPLELTVWENVHDYFIIARKETIHNLRIFGRMGQRLGQKKERFGTSLYMSFESVV